MGREGGSGTGNRRKGEGKGKGTWEGEGRKEVVGMKRCFSFWLRLYDTIWNCNMVISHPPDGLRDGLAANW